MHTTSYWKTLYSETSGGWKYGKVVNVNVDRSPGWERPAEYSATHELEDQEVWGGTY